MRLNCPNCGAEYEVSDGMVPATGRHVQCTACHTRWFIRGMAGIDLTEDQIMRRLESRLETWSPGPRPMPAPAPAAAPPEPSPPLAAEPATPARAPTEPPVVVHMPPRPAAPAKPADRPAVAQPAPLSAPPRPQPAARPATRLDLGEPAPPPAELPPPPPRSRFGRGFLLALALAAIALAAYLYRDPVAARVPAAGPALQAYGETVDRWRTRIEDRLAPFRRGQATEIRGSSERGHSIQSGQS